jgi:DNA-binding transcriptional ArsR family regulator
VDWKQKELRVFRLTDAEICILESLGTAKSISEIAEIISIPRTTIGYNLKPLLKAGLITQSKSGKRYRYTALNSEQVSQLLRTTIDEINIRNGSLKGVRIKTKKEDEFIIHVGKSEIIPTFKAMANSNKNERIKAIQHHRSHNQLLEKLTLEQAVEFNQSIIRNNLIVDGILNEGAYSSYWKEIQKDPAKFKGPVKSLEGRMADYSVFPDNRFNCDSEIWIFKTTTLIINWSEEVAIEITNSNMTNFLREMFEYVKDGSRKIDHNEAMKKLVD